jgi:hypothetical protein
VRRFLYVCCYGALGLLSTWLSLYCVSRLNFSFLPAAIRATGGCGDYGQCDTTLWVDIAFLAHLFLPTLVHLVVGYHHEKLLGKRIKYHVCTAVILLLGTMVFYASLRALHAI